jgi:hypothetical protein
MNNTEKKQDIDMSFFNAPSKDEIFYVEGNPRSYLLDCREIGGVRIDGSEDIVAKELQMDILAAVPLPPCFLSQKEIEAAQKGQGQANARVLIFFVDKDNALSCTTVKTVTLGNLMGLQQKLRAEGLGIAEVNITAKFIKKTTYGAFEFTYKKNTPERIEKLKEFYQANNGCFRTNLVEKLFLKFNPDIHVNASPLFDPNQLTLKA